MKSARTPLMKMLLQIMATQRKTGPFDPSRRKFIRQAVLGAGALSLGPLLLESFEIPGKPVVILGAGIAGLYAAYLLQKAGIPYVIYEASKRAGGRMYSAQNLTGQGITTELGAEFIDSGHEDMLLLAKEFDLPLLDMEEDTLKDKYTFYYGGRHYTCKDLADSLAPFAPLIAADMESLPDVLRYDNYGEIASLDRQSISSYLQSKGMNGWLLDLFKTAFTTEYGLDACEQSAINMLFLFDTAIPGCSLFGVSDERYKIKGGNQRITDELAKRVHNFNYGHEVKSIRDHNNAYRIGFANGKSTQAEHIICTIPFSILRNIKLDLAAMSPVKRECIMKLGYGRNAKTFAGFRKAVWREKGNAGQVFSSHDFQLGWDHSQMQGNTEAGYTFFTGGKASDNMRNVALSKKVGTYLSQFEQVFPGSKKWYNGKSSQFYWPTHPWSKASYACYKVGQWTTIAGAEIEPVGNILFAGEHCSFNFQGYMQGGAETGRMAAMQLMAQLKK